MRRVVITGMGIVSSIGNNTQEVLASLHEAKSGITRADKYAELGFRSQVQGAPTLDPSGVIDRRAFGHWGKLPRWSDEIEYNLWLKGARGFGGAFWDALGEKQNPAIVFEHPGETTLPTSCFMCETGGMIVICAGTTGYNATLDLRYHWMRQKRLQGSHFANDDQARGANELVTAGKVDPCLSRVFPFAETADCHQLMRDNLHPSGNMAILVNAPRPGLRTLADVRAEPRR